MDNMTDKELDQLLGHASTPLLPDGAAKRAAARALGENVVAFKPKAVAANQNTSTIRWLAALPLAASLAIGIYLGTLGSGSYVLPESLAGGATAYEDAVVSGVEDMEDLTDEDVS
jgi:hypothetical protein